MWQVNPEQAKAMLESIQGVRHFDAEAWQYETPEGKRKWSVRLLPELEPRVVNAPDVRHALMVLSDSLASLGAPEHRIDAFTLELAPSGEGDRPMQQASVTRVVSESGMVLIYEIKRVEKA